MSLVALHGFTQAGAMFAELAGELRQPIVAPDLPGHGAAGPVPATLEAAFGLVTDALDGATGAPILLGYSMGGRIALRYALDHPEALAGLVLVSASPGIADADARAARRREDDALAARICEIGIEAFLDEWLALPMFAGLARRGDAWRAEDRLLRSGNTAAGLAAALRGLGPGTMPDATPRRGELALPVLVVAGEADAAYRAHADAMASRIPGARAAVVSGAGHAVVGEDPAGLAAVVRSWLED